MCCELVFHKMCSAPVANAHYHSATTTPPPIPPLFAAFAQRLVAAGAMHTLPEAVLVNEYTEGQGIAAHVDDVAVVGEQVCSLSLGSSAVMEYVPLKKAKKKEKASSSASASASAFAPAPSASADAKGEAKQSAGEGKAEAEVCRVLLVPNSALIMSGEARYCFFSLDLLLVFPSSSECLCALQI